MPARRFHRPACLVAALGLALLSPAAQALNIVFKDVGATPMSGEQYAAFQSAASFWSSQLTDKVTVYVNIGFDNLGGSTVGTTTWNDYQASYASVRTHLVADARTPADASATRHLQAGPSLRFVATQSDLTTRFDDDGSVNNTYLKLTPANAKALGFTDTPTDASSPDATIKFSTGFAGNFAYTRVNGGVPGDKIDFITVAEHEIGHALGFVSGVTAIDYCLDHAVQCGTTQGFDGSAWYSTLDLFRYGAPNTLNLTVGGNPKPYFSVDGGMTAIQTFATGTHQGDGDQPSHFSTGVTTLMDPYVHYGQSYNATRADLLAMDAIGWDVTAAVPEPQTWALLIGGLGIVTMARRRRA